jgi:hypothetical protein
MALICAAGFVGLNVVFYVLSGSYFESHREVVANVGAFPTYSPEQMMKVRITFGWFAAAMAVGGFLTWFRPRELGHALPAAFGAAQLIGVTKAALVGLPPVLVVAWIVFGVLLVVLAVLSYFRRSRPAWAFLVAITAVFALFETFGATEIAGGLGISLWIALIFPGLKVIATIALVSRNHEYIDAGAVEV